MRSRLVSLAVLAMLAGSSATLGNSLTIQARPRDGSKISATPAAAPHRYRRKPTGSNAAQRRAAAKRRNQQRHRAHCRGRKS